MGYAASSPVVYHICSGSVCIQEPAVCVTWLNVGLQYLQCVSDGDASVLHQAIHIVPGLWPDVWLAPGCCLYLWWPYINHMKLTLCVAIKWQYLWPMSARCRLKWLGGLMPDCSISIALTMKILQSCAKLSVEYMGYGLMPDWQSGHCQYLWWPCIDGLMQERRNSIANTLELVFLALTHQYILHAISYMHGFEMTGCVIFEFHMQAHISGWVDSRLKYLLCISNWVAAVTVIVCTLYDSSWSQDVSSVGCIVVWGPVKVIEWHITIGSHWSV